MSLRKLVIGHLLLSVIKLNDVAGAVLEAKKEARFAFIVDGEIVFANDVSDIIVARKALQASIALIAIPHREDVVTDEIGLH